MAALCLVLVAFAGCANKGGAKTQTDDGVPAVPDAPTFDEDTCAIAGIVVDDEFTPIAGADVGILTTGAAKISAQDGGFTFSDVQPGTYTLQATKARYGMDLAEVLCVAGEINENVQLTLPRIPDPLQPYMHMFPQQVGFIGCGIGFWSLAPETDYCPEANSQMTFVYDPYPQEQGNATPPITGVVVEVRWTPNGAFGGQYLQMNFPLVTAAEHETRMNPENHVAPATPTTISGSSPIQLTFESIDVKDPIYTFNQNANMTYKIRPGGGAPNAEDPLNDGSSKLIKSQSFEHYLALFYLGQDVPESFTMLE